jgi:hypothetical protein
MSLDFYLKREKLVSYDKGKTFQEENERVFWRNITHNLGNMAEKAGIYEALWRPFMLKADYKPPIDKDERYKYDYSFEKNNIVDAKEIIKVLEKGLAKLKSKPEYFQKFDSPNGWGSYIHFVPFVESVLDACKEYPDAIIEVWR